MEPLAGDGVPARRWFQRGRSVERRKAKRQQARGLIAYYWDGGAPAAHEIRGISSSGMYLVTDQRWYLGTLVTMTLQSANLSRTDAERAITVQAKAVRSGKDGVGFAFLLPEVHDSKAGRHGSNLADKHELEAFLQRFLLNHRRDAIETQRPSES